MDRITTTEASKLLKCSTARIRQLVGTKRLRPCGKIGQTYIFKLAIIEQEIERRNGKRKAGKKSR